MFQHELDKEYELYLDEQQEYDEERVKGCQGCHGCFDCLGLCWEDFVY